jgi:hypothetical protein
LANTYVYSWMCCTRYSNLFFKYKWSKSILRLCTSPKNRKLSITRCDHDITPM